MNEQVMNQEELNPMTEGTQTVDPLEVARNVQTRVAELEAAEAQDPVEKKPLTKDERVAADAKFRAAMADLEPLQGRAGLKRLVEAGTFIRMIRTMQSQQRPTTKKKKSSYGENVRAYLNHKNFEATKAKKQAKLQQQATN